LGFGIVGVAIFGAHKTTLTAGCESVNLRFVAKQALYLFRVSTC